MLAVVSGGKPPPHFFYFLAQVEFILTFFNMDCLNFATVIPSGGLEMLEIMSIRV
jgi:hypothetical protein